LERNVVNDGGLRHLAAGIPSLVELRLSGCAFGPYGGTIT